MRINNGKEEFKELFAMSNNAELSIVASLISTMILVDFPKIKK